MRARTADVQDIGRLIALYAGPGRRLLKKSAVKLYEDVQEFWVAEERPAVDAPRDAPEDAPPGSEGAPRGAQEGAQERAAEGEGGASGASGARGRVVGCGALHVMWEDLAEVRSVAVVPGYGGRGIGHRIVTRLLDTARELGVRRVFCLTFEVEFFARHGFRPILGTPVSPEVYEELLRSYDEGVAEFLDLDRVKPNTLGNTRMLLRLED